MFRREKKNYLPPDFVEKKAIQFETKKKFQSKCLILSCWKKNSFAIKNIISVWNFVRTVRFRSHSLKNTILNFDCHRKENSYFVSKMCEKTLSLLFVHLTESGIWKSIYISRVNFIVNIQNSNAIVLIVSFWIRVNVQLPKKGFKLAAAILMKTTNLSLRVSHCRQIDCQLFGIFFSDFSNRHDVGLLIMCDAKPMQSQTMIEHF